MSRFGFNQLMFNLGRAIENLFEIRHETNFHNFISSVDDFVTFKIICCVIAAQVEFGKVGHRRNFLRSGSVCFQL